MATVALLIGLVVATARPSAEALWDALAAADAREALRAVRLLAARPDASVPLLRERMRPAAPPDAGRADQLLRDLDDPRFATRDRAMRAWLQIGQIGVPYLQKALASNLTLEARRRVEQLLERMDKLGVSSDQARGLRAVQVLERVNTAAARALLREWAQGLPGAPLTRAAVSALGRLEPAAGAP